MRRVISISTRLTVWFGVIFLAGWVLFGAAMWLNLQRNLSAERHLTLSRRIDRLQEMMRRNERAPAASRAGDFRDFATATGGGRAEVFRADGSVLWPSPSSTDFSWPPVGNVSSESFFSIHAEGQPYLVIERSFRDEAWGPLVLVAAAPQAANLELLAEFRHGMFTLAPVLLLISMAGGYWMSRRALGPVDRITVAVRSIGIRNLSERLPVSRSGDELERLAETCNDMLARLEVAVLKLKQFTADASHELRGPLSLTRTIAEVALRQPDVDASSREALNAIIEESANAAVLLEQMLELARADSEPTSLILEPVDLAEIVADGCAMATTLGARKNIEVSLALGTSPALMVLGHASSLRRLLWILLDNALKYTPSFGHVRVSLENSAGHALLRVEDSGIGIAPGDVPRIFDRFYRADPSRAQVEGSGLGLSIAKWIADTHHAEIQVSSHEGQGSRFTVVFTLA
ncbi:sensor histidine kinase [Silvibacterium dinghuense]|uniref:histidine kinase n=1 Tax=Silvibacterium dinghuense TaxID=1560006 RepID=A0A4V1NVV7_9BACT|nr:ATP-binding protein [Silvibacterium dinghuense]RXS97262.1 HAMP domain-containing protein [Silvibacterium dinghuense]GGG97590.1 two-component sensor histidine kinase [Silvibacterium dinghuense]